MTSDSMRLFLLVLMATVPLHARTRSVNFAPPPERILWIAAHPDDEALIAPLLGSRCVEGRAACTLLVLTRGEAGDCKLPGGCGDVGALRAQEMAAAGALFRARVIHWSHPDVFNPESVWPSSLKSDIAGVIAAERPDVIYTFDPVHGSSCHPAHRYAAQLVLEVANAIPVRLIETVIIRDGGAVTFAAATAGANSIEARRWWWWLIEDLKAHPSQFSPEEVYAIAHLPEDRQRVWLMDSRLLAGTTYLIACPPTLRKRSSGK
jgi:LmbE family N-acetylglucosaminyl deacetylase